MDNATTVPTLVSVIVTTKDRAPLLGRQLAAVQDQDYAGPFEIVVSDDGSRDATAALLADVARRDDRLVVVHGATSRGSSHARNVGAAVARGELLAFCDDDDVVPQDWLRCLVDASSRADVVCGVNRPCLSVGSGTLVPLVPAEPPPRRVVVVRHLDFLPSLQGGNMAYWTRVTDTIGGWDESLRFASDVDLAWRAQLAGFRYHLAEDAVVDWMQRTRLREVFRQRFRWGVQDALLVSRYRGRGCPEPSVPILLRLAAAVLMRSYQLLLGPPTRRRSYVEWASQRSGRLAGSLRYRVRCV
ncbi:MAG: glycosyltransferase family 2 protein [Acidimicrobiales bacterium]